MIRQYRHNAQWITDQARLTSQCQQLEQSLVLNRQQLTEQQQEIGRLQGQRAVADDQLAQLHYWRDQAQQLNNELRQQLDINREQEAELREATTRLHESRRAAEERQTLLINSEQRLSSQFENLASRIFANSNQLVDQQNRQSLENLLMPLREQLEGFRRHVTDSFSQESRERHTLTHEIRQLQQLNSQMAQETLNLTRALKGDNKAQGNWGEIVLSRVLEASGLREGYEYQTQVNIQAEQGRYQPDVIVKLPQNKEVIIDAKMTLVAYERYFNATDDVIRTQAIQQHIQAVRQHIRLLSRKDYHRLPGIRSLDYVLLFIPIEPAFLLALDREPELISEALKQNIMLVSPTTLLVALRTISNLWRYEHQSQNAEKIAAKASRLYDKMRLFVEDMNNLGSNLAKAQQSYQQAVKKLATGRGNMIAQADGFRQLGVEVKRPVEPLWDERPDSADINVE